MLNGNSNIFIFGARGMVGRNIIDILTKKKIKNVNYDQDRKDLTDPKNVNFFLNKYKPHIVILAAAKVGGILENNKYPYEFLLDNLKIQNNIIEASKNKGIKKFLFLGSSCVYPKSDRKIKENDLLKSSLEDTNQWYALAKISGLKLCEAINLQFDYDYRCIMPTNLFGENDNYKGEYAHVIPALIEKFDLAKKKNFKTVNIWGSGKAKREFLYVRDLSEIIHKILKTPKKKYQTITGKSGLLNIGSGEEMTIKELAIIIKKIVGFNGHLNFENKKLEGVKRKFLDTKKLKRLIKYNLTPFDVAIKNSYVDFLKNNN